jgi:preprotein translocase subunit SecF
MEFFHKTNIDFLGFRYKAFIISGVIIIAGLVSMISKGGYRLSVEFRGGMIVQVRFDQPIAIADLRASMARAGYANAEIQQYGERGNEYIIKLEKANETDYASNRLIEGLERVSPGRSWRVVTARELPPDLSKGFEGATLVEVEADSIPAIEGLTNMLKQDGYGVLNATTETSKRAAFRLPLLGLEAKIAEAVKAEIANDFPDRTVEIRRTETIGPKIGKELSRKAWAAVVVSLFGILVYVSWRFEFKFAIGAIVALAHDVLVTLGIFSILDREISLFVVAALLTIVGYSINDTIVVYDRIRENFGLRRRESYEGMLNVSVNETLSRTIITVLTVFIANGFLLFLGGEFIRDFSIAMLIGLLTGTYSSIYVASAIVIEWQNRVTMRRKPAATSR